MRISPVHGTDGSRRQRFFVDVWEQWSSLFGRCNWYDFTSINLGGEFAPYTGRWEFSAGLLGLHVRLTYVYDYSFNDEMTSLKDEIVAGIKAETGAEEVIDPTGALDRLDER